MAKYFIARMVNWLIKQNAIEEEERELYVYALECLLMTVAPLVIILMMGVIVGKVLESIIIIVPFMCMRKFCGGYHASNPIVCLITSIMLLGGCLYASDILKGGIYLHSIVILCAISIGVHSPIDSESRELSVDEKSRYKKISQILCTFFGVLYFVAFFCGKPTCAVCIAISLILSAGLQIPVILFKVIKRNQRGLSL